MSIKLPRIVSDGQWRFREAIRDQVRREHEQELAAATDYWQKVAVEDKINREVKERIKRMVSPYSL